MKSALVFLSVIALSCALTFGTGKQVTINDDGTLTILGENGKKIVISNAIGGTGPRDIEISIGGPFGTVKKISVDGETNSKTINLIEPSLSELYNTEEDRAKRSSKDGKDSKNSKGSKEYKGKEGKPKTQAQLLQEIFSEHQDATDAKSYSDLLNKVDSYVKSGQLNSGVYDVIRSLRDFNGAVQNGNQQPLRYPGYGYPVETPVPSYYQPLEQYPYSPYSPYGYGYNNNNLGGYGGAYGINQGLYPSGMSAQPANPWSNMWASFAQQKIASKPTTPLIGKDY
ncbi:uncharacterized protein [Diabrotica undecimpunctata]|uniref:uncharacterized protein n=1 Tax=Diabrotica undecimpunctata TaxID=50387 RepID=UPI003B639990